jgi:membrane-bound serine protease (ClpP class)
MRRPDPRRVLVALAFTVLASLLWPAGAGAQDGTGGIDVVQVDGLLDPANAALVERVVRDAERDGATLLVLQLDATGAVDTDVLSLVDLVADSTVPVGVWVGPSGADARGASALLALAAPVVAVAPGAGIGPIVPVRLDDTDAMPPDEVVARAAELQDGHGRETGALVDLLGGRLSANDASDAGLVDGTQPTVGEFIVSLDGQTVATASGPVRLDTADVVGEGQDRRRRPNQQVRFHKLDLVPQVAHTLVTPWVAFFLFVAGAALIVFEFFTASFGIAGFVGAVAVAGAAYGFSHLPITAWALALLVVAMVGLSVDVQAGVIGAWTFIGSACLVAGSVWLYGGSSRLDPAWWVLVLVCGGTVVFMLSGMTAMVRSRFSTPTVGREELVGELGVAEVDVAPDGVVRVRDALWRARTNRATPIRAGANVRVVAVQGILLEVEPEEGGARDYRDRARRR